MISQSELYNAHQHRRSLAAKGGRRTAFLCHSHRDRSLAEGLQEVLREAGLDLYIDWQDEAMPDRPSRVTAERIRTRIVASDFFLYLATQNSAESKWCPWELGYADGKKPERSILVVPTRDAMGGEHGNEYIHLYRRIDRNSLNQLQFIEASAMGGNPVYYL